MKSAAVPLVFNDVSGSWLKVKYRWTPRFLILVAQATMSLWSADPGWASAMARHCTKLW